MKKRFLAMALCLAMTLSLFPTGAFANPENEPAASSSEAVAEIVQEQQTEALPEAAGKTEKTENEAPAVPVTAEAEIAAEAEKADAEPTTEAEKAGGEALAEPEKAESEASGEPAKADSEPAEPEAETAKEPAAENGGSKWDALKNSIANLFGGGAEPASIQPPDNFKVDTYKFFVGEEEQTNWTQRVAAGDTLKIPGTPKKDGYVFEGWFNGEAEVKGGQIKSVSGTEVIVNAKFREASYVHFMGTDCKTVMHTVQGAKGEPVNEDEISTAEAKVRLTLKGEQSVQGWSETQGDSTPLDSIVFIEGTRTLYPVVKSGYWVTFDSDGGSYIAPKFIIEDQTLDLSKIEPPTKAGYDFTGWYQDGKQVETVSGKATVTAHWQAQSNVQYTVIYWQENANDDRYSFAESETKTGTAGTEAKASTKPYKGFTLNTDTDKTEHKTIAGDGSTILNVYYKRNVYEVKFYRYGTRNWNWNWNKGEEYTNIRITAKYGADISKKWPKVENSSTWRVEDANVTDAAYQVNIDTMPLNGANFYGPKTGYGSETAYYYVEVLPGESGEKASDGRVYKLHHKDTSPGGGYLWGYSVTKEDRYPIAGFALVERISTRIGASYDGAKFYYSRNSYDINFYSGKTFVHNISRKFQESIANVSYEPSKPDNIPANYQFAGWYANELCEGDAFKFEGTMPANDIILYAKWAAPQIKVTIEGIEEPIWVDYGSKLEDSDKWNALVKNLQPEPNAWMIDGKIFNLDTKLHEDITLTPYYKNEATPCTITYFEHGIPSWPDTTQYAKGGTATILNPKNRDGLKFQHWKKDDGTTYLPGESIPVTGDVTLTAVYDEPPEGNLKLTYHIDDKTYEIPNLLANSEQTAKAPAELDNGFKAPPGKAFAGWTTKEDGRVVEYEKGQKFYITKDGNNDLYAVWVDLPDISDENVASIDSPNDVPYDGNPHQWEPIVTKTETQETLKKDTDYTVSYSTKDFTNVTGEITVTITGKGNYTGTVERTYQITPLAIEVTANSDSKVYDGSALKNSGYTITGGKFVGEEGFESVQVEGSQTEIGNSKNIISSYTLKSNTLASNYTITPKNGTLTITGQSIVPDPNNPESYKGITISDPTNVTYDGNPHKWAPTVKDKNGNALIENTDYTVAYNITQKATPDYRDYTDVCTIEVTITGIGNYTGSVTKTYRITPRKVTLTSETASKPYDGTPLTKPNVTITGDGFVAGEAYKILAHGTVTEVKDSPVVNEISYKVTENYKGDNYIVTYERGKLSITGQSIVPDPDNPESYKGIAISDPTDATYDGKEHKWAPEVKDKEGKALAENTDYAVSYDKDDFTNVGTIKVTITGIGNYTGKVEKSYKILPATLTVTTNSAEKTHDGNRLTADGTIKGFVNGETATFMITGSQTDVGSSTNTYKIEWNGTAKQSNYTVVEKLGTLKVNERSGGGGSSSTPTPAPEQTPTPTPAPVIVPPAPAPAPTPAPARRITPAARATPTPAPTAKPTETKQPEPEPEVIEDEETPLAPMPTGAWALVNLILMLLTVLASLLLLIGYLGKKKHTERDEYGNKRIDYTRNKKGFWRVASLIPAIAAVIAFVLTENMKLPMIMVDRWTLLMAVIAVLQLIVAVMSKKQKESQDEEDEANA